MNRLKRFLQSEEGPTAVEYAVMMALILMACLVMITSLGAETGSSFSNTHDKISTAIAS
jgi:pilus assembly protein Flp/PilA